jgi:hypothetical protein
MLACLNCPVNKQVEEIFEEIEERERRAVGTGATHRVAKPWQQRFLGWASASLREIKEANQSIKIALLRFCDRMWIAELKLEIS